MASIIPGYEYDIFISYRQKDNKHDSWVTTFFDNPRSYPILEIINKMGLSEYSNQ